jgi:hypothetical protein
LPRVEEVMSWLEGNSLITTQPFAAFVEVFEKHGEGKDAKKLRVAKADAELCLKTQHIFGNLICGSSAMNAPATQAVNAGAMHALNTSATQNSAQSLSLGRSVEFINDFAAVIFGWLLWLIADHGYHPENVVWYVVGAIVIFLLLFRRRLKVVGLKPEGKDRILPIGVGFLFDRLLPAYHIREDHYRIESFYKLASVPRPDIRTMRYLWWKDIKVVPANDAERQQVEKLLDVLKVIGLILAIFLVATINAIVSH